MSSPLHRDPPTVVLTVVVSAVAAWAWIANLPIDAVRVVVLPAAALALWRGLRRIDNRRRRRFWLLWVGALAAWWTTALLSILGGIDPSRVRIADLAGYLLVLASVASHPRPRRSEDQQAAVHQLRLSALLTALVSSVAYVVLLGGGPSARTAAVAVLPLLDLCGAALLLHLAWRPRGRLWQTCGLLALGLGVLTMLHLTDVAASEALAVEAITGPGRWRSALEVLPFWLIGVAGRLRDREQTLPSTVDTRLFPLPSALWIGTLPLLHLLLDPPNAESTALRVAVVVSTTLLTVLALAEHRALSRRNTRLELARREAARQFGTRSVYLQSLIEHNPLAIVVLDADHLVRLCNPAFERMFGYNSNEVLGTSLDRIISTDENRRQAYAYTARVLAGETVHAQAVRRRKDDQDIEVELWGVPLLKQGELIGIFAIYQDVTDRRRAEAALRDSEERFRRLSEATFEGIVLSENGIVLDSNEQYARMMGGVVDDIIGRPVLDFVAPLDLETVAHSLSQNTEKAYEHRALTLQGKELRVEVHDRALSADGRRMRVSAVRDVTAHRRLEEEMRQAQKMEAVGRLAGGIAHDFNNVLTVIKGYAQLLGRELEGGRLSGQVNEIREAAERASSMTQRLLAFGRKQALEPSKLDLNEVLRGTEKMVRSLIRADIELQLDLDDGLGTIHADPGQLEQVVLNLVINAGDAMPEGGLLRLRTRNVVIDLDDPGAPHAVPGTYVRFEVRDSGLGMDDVTRSQVFEPFFTTKEEGKGTGLGLATVYAIVQQNGGVIDVDSEVDQGTTFSILLPRAVDPEPEDTMVFHAPEVPQGTETILVVEDEPGVRSLARELLESSGYRVLEAEDGKKALAIFADPDKAPHVDLVLTDVVMPGLNGPAMARRLLESKPEMEVLFMSGYTDEILGPEDLSESWRLVRKPFTMEELLHKVRAVLDRSETIPASTTKDPRPEATTDP